MIQKDYQLENTVQRTTENITLWETEKGFVEISKDALAAEVKLSDDQKGYVFHGHGRLVLDAIVETAQGAIGKPIEKQIDEPFLMLGDPEQAKQHLVEANNEDLARAGYQGQEKFIANAEELLKRFTKRGSIHTHQCCGRTAGSIFAFRNKSDELDLLVLNGQELVYKAANMVFVAHRDRTLLKSPRHIAMSNNGKCCIV